MTATTDAAGTTRHRVPEQRRDRLVREDFSHVFDLRVSDFVVVGLLGLVQGAALAAFVVLTRRVIEALTPTGVGDAAVLAYRGGLRDCAILAAVGVVIGIARTLEFTRAERAGYEVVRRLRMDMYGHLQRMRPEHLRHRARGGLLLRLTGDLSMLRMWLSRGLLEGISAAIVLTVGLGVVFWLDLWMGLAVVCVLALGAAMSLGFGRSMREATRTMRRRRSLLMGNIDEQINTVRVSQVSGRTAGEYARLSRQNDSLTRALCRVAALRGQLRGLAAGASLVSVAAVLAVGVVEVRRGTTTVGAVIACALLARYLARPVRTLGLAHDYWHRGLVSRQKVLDFLVSSSRHPAEDELDPLAVRGGRVEFVDVTVPGALRGFSAVADRGELIAITGPSGSGKSTLLGILARLVEPASGEVVVDGQRLADTAPSSVGSMVGVASPDLPLLRGTLRRNLTYAARRAPAGEVQRVVKSLGLDESLARHGHRGLSDWVTEGGANLTVGDRQLVSVARAMMGTPRILLLDEPMAGLDVRSRSLVREAVLRHRGTVLMVTQDPDALSLADSVWILSPDEPAKILTGEEYREQLWRTRSARNPRWPVGGV